MAAVSWTRLKVNVGHWLKLWRLRRFRGFRLTGRCVCFGFLVRLRQRRLEDFQVLLHILRHWFGGGCYQCGFFCVSAHKHSNGGPRLRVFKDQHLLRLRAVILTLFEKCGLWNVINLCCDLGIEGGGGD